jgi:hypothetical protein
MNNYIDTIRQVTVRTLDKDDIECVRKYRAEQTAVKYFNRLKDNRESHEIGFGNRKKLLES